LDSQQAGSVPQHVDGEGAPKGVQRRLRNACPIRAAPDDLPQPGILQASTRVALKQRPGTNSALLQVSAHGSLAVLVKDDSGLWQFGDYRWVTALEAVASVLVQYEPGNVQHTLAAAILSKPSTLLQLSVRDGDCKVACQYLAILC